MLVSLTHSPLAASHIWDRVIGHGDGLLLAVHIGLAVLPEVLVLVQGLTGLIGEHEVGAVLVVDLAIDDEDHLGGAAVLDIGDVGVIHVGDLIIAGVSHVVVYVHEDGYPVHDDAVGTGLDVGLAVVDLDTGHGSLSIHGVIAEMIGLGEGVQAGIIDCVGEDMLVDVGADLLDLGRWDRSRYRRPSPT